MNKTPSILQLGNRNVVNKNNKNNNYETKLLVINQINLSYVDD